MLVDRVTLDAELKQQPVHLQLPAQILLLATRQSQSFASPHRAPTAASRRVAPPASSTRPAAEGDSSLAVVPTIQPPLPAPSREMSMDVRSTDSMPALAALFTLQNAGTTVSIRAYA